MRGWPWAACPGVALAAAADPLDLLLKNCVGAVRQLGQSMLRTE